MKLELFTPWGETITWFTDYIVSFVNEEKPHQYDTYEAYSMPKGEYKLLDIIHKHSESYIVDIIKLIAVDNTLNEIQLNAIFHLISELNFPSIMLVKHLLPTNPSPKQVVDTIEHVTFNVDYKGSITLGEHLTIQVNKELSDQYDNWIVLDIDSDLYYFITI